MRKTNLLTHGSDHRVEVCHILYFTSGFFSRRSGTGNDPSTVVEEDFEHTEDAEDAKPDIFLAREEQIKAYQRCRQVIRREADKDKHYQALYSLFNTLALSVDITDDEEWDEPRSVVQAKAETNQIGPVALAESHSSENGMSSRITGQTAQHNPRCCCSESQNQSNHSASQLKNHDDPRTAVDGKRRDEGNQETAVEPSALQSDREATAGDPLINDSQPNTIGEDIFRRLDFNHLTLKTM